MIEKAVLDRFEGTYAVLLVGKNKRLLNVPEQLVPRRAKVGALLKVIYDGHELLKIEMDTEADKKSSGLLARKHQG